MTKIIQQKCNIPLLTSSLLFCRIDSLVISSDSLMTMITKERGNIMKLSAPKQVTWIVAVVLAVLALLVKFAGFASLTVAFWLALASAVLLVLATFFAGL